MSAHTPAPWAVNPAQARVDAMPSCLPVCQLLWPTDARSERETEANARLIAEAPELLDALQELADLVDLIRTGEYTPDSFTTQPARIAIAKATGGAA